MLLTKISSIFKGSCKRFDSHERYNREQNWYIASHFEDKINEYIEN
jgi:hypothetical protein